MKPDSSFTIGATALAVGTSDDLLRECDELVAVLKQHPEHYKLRALLVSVEELRSKLLMRRDRENGETAVIQERGRHFSS